MVRITLPDGSVKEFGATTTGGEVAASIGAGLAKAAVAVEVDGVAQDLSEPITKDVSLKIATAKDALGLDTMRHTLAAQVLALAVKARYPDADLAIGPTIENGFYYDIAFKKAISSDDLPVLEEDMRKIIASGRAVERHLYEPNHLIRHFMATGDSFKAKLIEEIVEKGQMTHGKVSAYLQKGSESAWSGGGDFVDLCRGPHVPDLGKIGLAFKLTNLAGAYWKGDAANEQLTRIYCVAFATQKELDAYLLMRDEAEKRDHRKLGKELGLFHLQEEAPGQAFWHPKGWALYRELEHFVRENLKRYNYKEVNTPRRVNKSLYVQSGHWQNYREDLFLFCDDVMQPVANPVENADKLDKTLGDMAKGIEDLSVYAIKPMNCPCHVQIFNQGSKSYRDLPLRMSEFGACMRNEAHGALHGLMRVTSFTQDDAHVFCTVEQMEDEIIVLTKLIAEMYAQLGFHDYTVRLATRPEKRAGDDSLWDTAEKALAEACVAAGLEVTLAPGDGAFYGPKLEYHLKDAIGRTWQCGTIQLDFVLPIRMGANYTNEHGERVPCVMIHRAILGTLERFTGILIEQYEGKFPTWLAPVQAVVVPITDHQNEYAEEVRRALEAADVRNATGGLRVEVDSSSERMQKKILMAQQQKVPYMLVVGKQEAADGTVAVRLRDGTDLGAKPLAWVIARMKGEVEGRKDSDH